SLAFPGAAAAAGWAPAAAQPEPDSTELLALPGGEAFSLSAGIEELRVSHRPPGAAFGAPEPVAEPSGGTVRARLVNAGGATLLVWSDEAGAHVTERTAGGDWVLVPGAFGPAFAMPALGAAAGGGTLAAWREGTELRAREQPSGGGFGAVQVVASDLPPAADPRDGDVPPAVTTTEDGFTVVVWGDREFKPRVGEPGEPGYRPATAIGTLRLAARPSGGDWAAPVELATRTMTSDFAEETPSAGYTGISAAPRPGGGWIAAARSFGETTLDGPSGAEVSGSDAVEVREGAVGSVGTGPTYDAGTFDEEMGGEAAPWPLAVDPAGDVAVRWRRLARDGDVVSSAYRPAAGDFPAAPTAPAEMRGTVDVAPLGGARWYWLDAGDVAYFGQPLGLDASPSGLPPAGLAMEGEERLQRLSGDGAGHVFLAAERIGSPPLPLRVYDEVAPALMEVAVPAAATPGQPLRMAARAEDLWTAASVEWDFGDGATATGDGVEHAFAAPGRYTVRVTAVDAAANRTT
ncbi:MAG TPA: PKD domain-containing protein, partial [Solirubrobacteraceae bacterium]